MPQPTLLSFPPGVAFQQLGEDQDSVMMSLVSGYLYRCNPTASVLLAAISSGKSLEEAVIELASEFEIDLDTARSDAETLIQSLKDRDLVCEAA